MRRRCRRRSGSWSCGRGASDLGIQCGGWTIAWQGKAGVVTRGSTTILEGIRKTAPGAESPGSPTASPTPLSSWSVNGPTRR